jgi:hypothetical protein
VRCGGVSSAPIVRTRTYKDFRLDTHPELHLLNERKIAQLHRYNEIKDFAHVLLGALAEEQLTTVKELYRVFNMEV